MGRSVRNSSKITAEGAWIPHRVNGYMCQQRSWTSTSLQDTPTGGSKWCLFKGYMNTAIVQKKQSGLRQNDVLWALEYEKHTNKSYRSIE